jgi:hypothetical protein
MAQQPRAPGSPSGTTTADGKQLPVPDPKFGGVIKEEALQFKRWWAPRVFIAENRTGVPSGFSTALCPDLSWRLR